MHLHLPAPRAQCLPAWTHLHTRVPRCSGCKLLFWLQSGYVSAQGMGTRKGNFHIMRGRVFTGPLELLPCHRHILAARMVLGQGAQCHPGRSSLVSSHPWCCRAHELPSSHLKSGKATSWSGICRRKSGFWHRGFPVTIFLLRSQSPSQASWQLQLKGLASRFLHTGKSTRAPPEQPPGKGTCSPLMQGRQAGGTPWGPGHTVWRGIAVCQRHPGQWC